MADEPTVNEPTATGAQDPKPQDPKGETPTVADWEAVLGGLTDEHKALYEKHVSGLKSALEKERDRADTEAKKAGEAAQSLRKLAKEADETTAAALNKLADEKDAELADARFESEFYREAAAAGIPGDKLARALLICKTGDFKTRRGGPDVAAMKAELPELFAAPAVPAPRTNAGAGTQQPPAAAHTFDENVRRIAKGG